MCAKSFILIILFDVFIAEPPRLNNMSGPINSSSPHSLASSAHDLASSMSSLSMGSSLQTLSQVDLNQGLPHVRYYTNTNFTPMKWHTLCGKNISMSYDKLIATRSQDEYCNGYVFSSRPLNCGEKIVIQILGVDRSYVGGLGVGLTACSPSKVTLEDLPDDSDLLLDRLEYWVVNKDVCRSPELGDELCFHLTNEGKNSTRVMIIKIIIILYLNIFALNALHNSKLI